MREIDKIILHGNKARFEDRPMYSIFYSIKHNLQRFHYTIDAEGRVFEDLPVFVESRWDKTSLDVRIRNSFYEQGPQRAQLDRLAELAAEKCEAFDIPIGRVYAHREIGEKVIDCLGEHFDPIGFFEEIWENYYSKRISKERNDDKIILHNLRLMNEKGRGHMHYLLANESIGGTAGKIEGLTCMGINFYYDSRGEIQYFGNVQFVPEKIHSFCKRGFFRIAVHSVGEKLVNKGIAEISKDLSGSARKNIEESVRVYNRKYGF